MCDSFIPYRTFLRMHNLKEIYNYNESEMDILKGPRAMNALGDGFCIGDVILVNKKKYMIIAFGGYDDEYVGAIVIGKKSGYARYVSIENAVNLKDIDNGVKKAKELLSESGFKHVS